MGRSISVHAVSVGGTRIWRANIPDPRTGQIKQVRPFKDSGIPYSKKTKKKAERLAGEILDAWIEEFEQERAARPRLTLAGFLKLAHTDPGRPRRSDRLSPETIKQRTAALDQFEAWMGDREPCIEFVDEVTPVMIDTYLQERFRDTGCSEVTVARNAQYLNRAWNYGRERQLVDASPVAYRARRSTLEEARAKVRRKAFTDDELCRIWDACDNGYTSYSGVVKRKCHGKDVEYDMEMRDRPPLWFRKALELACMTGLRAGAIRGLTWESIDFQKSVITTYDGNKVGVTRTLISKECEQLLRRLRDEAIGEHVIHNQGKKIQREAITKTVDRVFGALKIKGKSFHSARHWRGLKLAEASVPLHHFMQLMGLTQVETAKIYMKDDIESYAEEFRAQELGALPVRGERE
ncbi:MAG: site-specific integrase [Planctomycetota bacterium]